MIEIIKDSALIILGYASFWFIISVIIKRNDIVDIAWGLGYIVLSLYYLLTREVTTRGLLLFILVALWGLRLAIYVFIRNSNKKEDFRYLNWRNSWKYFYLRSFLQVYLLQGFLLLIIISPVSFVFTQAQTGLNLVDFLGLVAWLTGFVFESVGDYQMWVFKKDPANKGRIMTKGLWKYTRHPNYFGEVTLWWGLFIITLSSPGFYYGLIGPVTITLLILFVSGIPMLEKKYQGNQEFEEYSKRTSIFFPWPPVKKS